MKTLILILLYAGYSFGQKTLIFFYHNAFLPTNITGLELWFDGDKELTTSGWGDQSVNNRDMTLYGTPTISTYNGHKIVTLNGYSQYGNVVDYSSNQPSTIFIVFKSVTWTTNRYIFDGGNNSTNIFRQINTTPELGIYAGTSLAGNTTLAVDAWGIAYCVFNGASSILQINNLTATTGNAGTANAGGFTLGAVAAATGQFANISVGEIIKYGKTLTPAEVIEVKNYLSKKWGIPL